MGIKFTNNAEGTLTGGVGAGDTTNMLLTAGDSLFFPVVSAGPTDYFYITLVDVSGNREIIKVTEHQASSNIFQTFERAQDDTAAIAFAIGDKVQLRLPKVVLEEMQAEITANTTDQHAQDTDTSTDSTTFQIDDGNSGPLIKNNSGVMEIRNAADSAYANLKALGLTLGAALAMGSNAISGITTLTASGLATVGSLSVTGAITAVTDITSSGSFSGTIENETNDKQITARDHNGGSTPEVGNVIFGTGSPPAASGVPIGTLFIKYVA